MNNLIQLRTVHPYVTAHTFWASWDSPRNTSFLGRVPPNTEVFLHSLCEKHILALGLLEPRKEIRG